MKQRIDFSTFQVMVSLIITQILFLLTIQYQHDAHILYVFNIGYYKQHLYD